MACERQKDSARRLGAVMVAYVDEQGKVVHATNMEDQPLDARVGASLTGVILSKSLGNFSASEQARMDGIPDQPEYRVLYDTRYLYAARCVLIGGVWR
jgi:hypothetical protein